MTTPLCPDPLAAARPVLPEGTEPHGPRAALAQPQAQDGPGLSWRTVSQGAAARLAPVVLPADPLARARLVADWMRKYRRQGRSGLLPFVLLPLAACGGGAADPAATEQTDTPVTDLFGLVALLGGIWSVDADHGDVLLARQGADYVLTPDRGTAVTLAVAAAQGLVVPQITLSVAAADLAGLALSGAGAVAVLRLEAAPTADLSGITTSMVTASLDATGGVAFTAAADLGTAIVTLDAATAFAADRVSFATGADVATARFVVNGTATLVLTDAQIDAVSKTAAITGTGHVEIRAQLSDTTSESAMIRVNVALDGASGSSTLTFDLPADDNDTLVLAPGSQIALNGGTLIVDDGVVDLRNLSNAADFKDVANVAVNSGLILTVDQLSGVTSVTTGGSGRLEIVVEKAGDIATLAELLATKISFGASPPALSVQVAPAAADAAALETAIVEKLTDLNLPFVVNLRGENDQQIGTPTDPTGPGTAVTPGDLVLADFIDTGALGDLQSVDNSFALTTSGGSAGADPRFELSLDGGASWTGTSALQDDLAPGIYSFRAVVDDAQGDAVPSPARTVEIVESQFDLIALSQSGDDLTVGVMFKPDFDLAPEIESFDMVIDLRDTDFMFLPDSVEFAGGLTIKLANLVDGQLIIGAGAISPITNFEAPLFAFKAGRQGGATQLDIVIEDIRIDGADAGSAMGSFSFPSVLSSPSDLG